MSLAITAGVVGVAGAGASIYGATQQPEGMKQHEVPVNAYSPWADPLLSALSMNAGVGMGQFDANMYRQASPIQQLLAQAQMGGTHNKRQFRYLQSALGLSPEDYNAVKGLSQPDAKQYLIGKGMSPKQARDAMNGLQRAGQTVQGMGYGTLDDLFAANQAHLDKLPGLEAQFQPVADRMRAGQLASQDRIAGYLQNLPNLLTGDQNPFIDQLREEALVQSQKYGINPYKHLEQARATALQRALQLVSGEQQALGGQQAMALPVAQLRQQGGATAANVGAGQAQALAAALQSQQNAQAQQAAQYGQLGNTLGQFGLIGADMAQGPGTGTRAGNSTANVNPYFSTVV